MALHFIPIIPHLDRKRDTEEHRGERESDAILSQYSASTQSPHTSGPYLIGGPNGAVVVGDHQVEGEGAKVPERVKLKFSVSYGVMSQCVPFHISVCKCSLH